MPLYGGGRGTEETSEAQVMERERILARSVKPDQTTFKEVRCRACQAEECSVVSDNSAQDCKTEHQDDSGASPSNRQFLQRKLDPLEI